MLPASIRRSLNLSPAAPYPRGRKWGHQKENKNSLFQLLPFGACAYDLRSPFPSPSDVWRVYGLLGSKTSPVTSDISQSLSLVQYQIDRWAITNQMYVANIVLRRRARVTCRKALVRVTSIGRQLPALGILHCGKANGRMLTRILPLADHGVPWDRLLLPLAFFTRGIFY